MKTNTNNIGNNSKFSIMLFLILFVISIIVLRNYILLGRPFVSLEVLSDLIRANLPTYTLMYDRLSEGLSCWSWEMGLGTNMFSHADVFFDPFTYICFIAGRDNIGYMMGWSFALKIICEGITFSIFLRYLKIDKYAILVSSIAYAFCGYSLIMGSNLALGTVLVYLPIVLLGIEKYLNDKTKIVLIIGLTLIGLCSYYYFYVTGLFSIIYVLVRCKITHKKITLPLLSLAMCGVISMALASPSLLTQISLTLSSPRVSSGGKDVLLSLSLFIPDIPSLCTIIVRSFGINLLGTYDSSFIGAHYNGYNDFFQSELYIGCITLPFIVYYLNKIIKSKIKLISLFIIASLLISLPITSYIFTAFSTINYRWMFVIDITLCILFAISFSNMLTEKINCKTFGIITTCFISIVSILICFMCILTHTDLITLINSNWQYYIITIISLIILVAAIKKYQTAVISHKNQKEKVIKIFTMCVILLLSFNIVCNYTGWFSDNNSVSDFDNGSKYGYDDNSSIVISEINKNDSSFYRIYKDFDSVYDYNNIPSDNDAMVQKYYGLKNYNSLGNSNYITFLQTMGVYVACPPSVEYLKSKGIEPKDVTGADLNYINGIDEKYNLLDYLGVKYYLSLSDSGKEIPSNFIFSYSSNGVDVYINTNTYALAFINSKYMNYDEFMTLDYDQRNSTIMSTTIINEEHDVHESTIKSTCTLNYFSNDCLKFSADINDGKQIISFSIPYDKNWNIYIDGIKTNALNVNVNLLGVEITEGHHEVEIKYEYAELEISCYICISAIIILTIAYYIRYKTNMKSTK